MPLSRIDARNARPKSRIGLARLMRLLFAFGITVAALGSALGIYLESPTGLPKPRLLHVALELTDPNGEANLFSWYSTLILAAIGLLFLTAFLLKSSGERSKAAYLAIGIVAFYLSADEAATLHEKLNRLVALFWEGSPDYYGWLVVAVPAAALVGFVLLRVARTLERTLRNRLIIAGVVFLAGAVGFEVIDAALTQLDVGLDAVSLLVLHELAVFFEEMLEATGALIALWAICSHLRFERSENGVTLSTRE